MAENKKSFVLYCDLLHTVSHLTDEQAGKLFKHILSYVSDENPVSSDPITNIAFEPIKQQLKRDLRKWDARLKQKKKAGKKGGIKSGESRRSEAKLRSASKNEANEADNVTVTVNDTVTVIDLSEIEIGATIQFCSFSLSRDYDKEKISDLWQAFLINGQEENYAGRAKKIKHFRNWIKTQPYENGTNRKPDRKGVKAGNGKSEGANLLVASLREDFKRSG